MNATQTHTTMRLFSVTGYEIQLASGRVMARTKNLQPARKAAKKQWAHGIVAWPVAVWKFSDGTVERHPVSISPTCDKEELGWYDRWTELVTGKSK